MVTRLRKLLALRDRQRSLAAAALARAQEAAALADARAEQAHGALETVVQRAVPATAIQLLGKNVEDANDAADKARVHTQICVETLRERAYALRAAQRLWEQSEQEQAKQERRDEQRVADDRRSGGR